MNDRVFLDTNVLVYFYSNDDTGGSIWKQDSLKLEMIM